MPLYTFLCAANHQHDVIVPYDTQSVKCPTCGKKAKRGDIELPARRDHASHVPKQYISLSAARTLLELRRIFALPDYDPPAYVESNST